MHINIKIPYYCKNKKYYTDYNEKGENEMVKIVASSKFFENITY